MAQAPRYRELADVLRGAIYSGEAVLGVELINGAQLPTEPELGAHFQVSRGTIRQALRELAAEGLLETRGRSGTYVRRLPMLEYNVDAEDPHRSDDKPGSLDSWFSVVKRAGQEPSQGIRFRIEPASVVVAFRLGTQENGLVAVRECQRFVNGIPWSEQISYYPYGLARKCGLDTPEDIQEGTVRRMAAHGVVEDRLDHEISSRPASDDERRQFDLAPGVSVLVYQRIGRSKGDIIRYTCEVLPADRNIITHTTVNAVEQVR
jgi:GntR family transcriptional regulator